MKNGGANKDIWGMGKMIRTICERDELKDPEAFARLGFEKDDGQRDAFEFDFVRDTIRNKANFNMNDDAFDAMLVMVETGARPPGDRRARQEAHPPRRQHPLHQRARGRARGEDESLDPRRAAGRLCA